jgi:tetratricopeptide (TPR) repeat protein
VELRELKEEAGGLWSAGKFAQAEVLYRQMPLLNPRDGQLWVRHAEALRRLGRAGDAVDSYRRASQMLADEGHLPRAIAALRMALELRPEDIDLIAELIRAETRRTRARPRPLPARSETPAALLALPVLEEAVTNPGITIEVEPSSLDWPQVRRLSVRSLAIKTSPEAQWMILESADPIRLSFADELPEANDQELT